MFGFSPAYCFMFGFAVKKNSINSILFNSILFGYRTK